MLIVRSSSAPDVNRLRQVLCRTVSPGGLVVRVGIAGLLGAFRQIAGRQRHAVFLDTPRDGVACAFGTGMSS